VGERILVIGGTRGTGRLAAERLLTAGYRPRVLARNPQRARADLPAEIEVVGGDLTRRETLIPAMPDVSHVLCTAGITRVPAGEGVVRTMVYEGTQNILATMGEAGVPGRLVYMSVVGLTQVSPLALLLDLALRNVRHWRLLAEEEIRHSRREYTIARAGLLTDDSPGRRSIRISQGKNRLNFRDRVARADVAAVLVAALATPETRNVTLNVIGGPPPASDAWREALRDLQRDA
jgi:uncharacterized protein YbjT (DUF2867 family)